LTCIDLIFFINFHFVLLHLNEDIIFLGNLFFNLLDELINLVFHFFLLLIAFCIQLLMNLALTDQRIYLCAVKMIFLFELFFKFMN